MTGQRRTGQIVKGSEDYSADTVVARGTGDTSPGKVRKRNRQVGSALDQTAGFGFRRENALSIPISDPEYARRTLYFTVTACLLSLSVALSSLLWLKLTGSMPAAMSIVCVTWLVLQGFIPRLARRIDSFCNRKTALCVMRSREEMMFATSGFSMIVGLAVVAALPA